MPTFIPGIILAERFYREAVRPVLELHFPDLVHSAARLDFGSDVLGFDTPQSMDHDWGPKCTLFVSEPDYEAFRDRIDVVLGCELPFKVAGISTHFGWHDDGTRRNEQVTHWPICHGVTVTTPSRFFQEYLCLDPVPPMQTADWLTLPQQRLRTIASGKVFHDGLRELEPTRQALRWYPRDVWLYLLANQWKRIDQEAPFMARCGDVGDELGSRLVAARLVRELMRLCFLMERQYAPYAKWFGTAFARLSCAGKLTPLFTHVQDAADWHTREEHLSVAYIAIAQMHNDLAVTPAIDTRVIPFHSRPYKVPQAGLFVEALHLEIQSQEVRDLPLHVGSVDQFVDSTDILDVPARCRKLGVMYTDTE
jgi:hypothetical protein